jgi:hypothetical protein
LQEDLGKLENDVRSDAVANVAELRTRLGATYTHICEHFRFEEQNGYMDEVRKREPRLERIVQELGEEHRVLRQSLDALNAEARLATNVDEAFREKVRTWIERVRRHEARENALVQDAFNWDVAAED